MVDVLEKNMLRPITLLYVICANPLEIKGCKAEKKNPDHQVEMKEQTRER